MKTKVTRPQLKKFFGNNVLYCGYCAAQSIFNQLGIEPRFYNCGFYGWNFDVYLVDKFAIVTGYRNLFGCGLDYKKLRDLEKLASETAKNPNPDAIKEKLLELINAAIQ